MTTPRTVINHGEESVHYGADPAELPPLDLPQPTEPLHWGRTFEQPARWGALDARRLRQQQRRERLTTMLVRVIWIAAAAAIVLALHPQMAGG